MAKDKGKTKKVPTEAEVALKQLRKVYDLVNKVLVRARTAYSMDRQCAIAGQDGRDYEQASDEYRKVRDEADKKIEEFRKTVEEEYGLPALRKKQDALRDKVKDRVTNLWNRFSRIAIRVESGRQPEKVMDDLLDLAQEMGLMDDPPPPAA